MYLERPVSLRDILLDLAFFEPVFVFGRAPYGASVRNLGCPARPHAVKLTFDTGASFNFAGRSVLHRSLACLNFLSRLKTLYVTLFLVP